MLKTCHCGVSREIRKWPWICGRCSYLYKSAEDEGTYVGEKPQGLGDVIAVTLARLGIKKKKNCRCPQRQEALNKFGQGVVDKARKAAMWLHPR